MTKEPRFNPNKQTPEQRRLHHQTREDRQRKVYEVLCLRALQLRARAYQTRESEAKLAAAERDAANLARKLGLDSQSAAA